MTDPTPKPSTYTPAITFHRPGSLVGNQLLTEARLSEHGRMFRGRHSLDFYAYVVDQREQLIVALAPLPDGAHFLKRLMYPLTVARLIDHAVNEAMIPPHNTLGRPALRIAGNAKYCTVLAEANAVLRQLCFDVHTHFETALKADALRAQRIDTA